MKQDHHKPLLGWADQCSTCQDLHSGILELNVGGHYFSTTPETLAAAGPSFFSGLIGGEFGIRRDSKGCVFIDRDPKLFRYVLNFLRSQCTSLAVENDSRAKLKAILIEAEFFQVTPLIEHIQGKLGELDEMERNIVKAAAREKKQASVAREIKQHELAATAAAAAAAAVNASAGVGNSQIPPRGVGSGVAVWNLAPAQGPVGLDGYSPPGGNRDDSDSELDTPVGEETGASNFSELHQADLITLAAAAAAEVDF